MTQRRVWLDVDTGIDDALAILYAVAHPGLDLVGISCVSGNAPLAQVLVNTCAVLDIAAADPELPVAAGADHPLVEPVHATTSHGRNGLGDVVLPRSTRSPAAAGAPEMLRRTLLRTVDGPVILVALAPLTNLARLVQAYPEVTNRLEQIVILGGSLAGEREFNLAQDPEAAETVLQADLPITLYPLETFRQVAVAKPVAAELAASEAAPARLAGQLLARRRSRDGTDHYSGLIGDAGALVYLTDPALFSTERRRLEVGVQGASRGGLQSSSAGAPITVVTGVDPDRAAKAFLDVLTTNRPSRLWPH